MAAKLSLYEVGFAPAVEELLGTSIFYDEKRGALLYDAPEELQSEELGMRRVLGSAAVRLMAAARTEQRRDLRHIMPNVDVRDWNSRHQLTRSYLGWVAHQREEEVTYLARQLALVNAADQALAEGQFNALTEGSREGQAEYLKDSLASVGIGPMETNIIAENGQLEKVRLRGTLVIAPTGYGKTRMMGLTARALGAGKPMNSIRGDTEPVRVLLVEPSRDLINQVAGIVGDHTFEHAAGVKPGRFFTGHKEDTADIVALTPKMFKTHFKNGILGEKDEGEKFDILMVDEAQILTNPAFQKAVIDNWRGMLYGFTATHKYDEIRNAQRILPHVVQHEDMLSCIENGTLNGAQLFMLPITREDGEMVTRDEADEKVADFLAPLITEGRRGIVFCESGQRSLHARTFAERLSMLTFPDGRPVRAEAIGRFDYQQSIAKIEEYHKGNLEVLVTTNMGSWGLNAPFDFVFIHRLTSSLLNTKQIVGRGTRVSARFPFTVYGQSYIVGSKNLAKSRTIYEALDLETIEQGVAIGPRSKSRPEKLVGIAAFPEPIKKMLGTVNARPTGEVFIAPGAKVEVPEGYISLNDLIAGTTLSVKKAIRKLSKVDFDWVGVRNKGAEGRGITRYYEPAAEDLFVSYRRSASGESVEAYIPVVTLANKYGFGWRPMKRIIEESCIVLEEHPPGTNTRGFFIKKEDEVQLDQIIDEKFPIAEPEEYTAPDLVAELGEQYKSVIYNIINRNGIKTTQKRNKDGRGTGKYVQGTNADFIRAEIRKRQVYPIAPTGTMSERDLTAALGIRDNVLDNNMTDEEKAQAQKRWIENSIGTMMLLPTWTREEAQAIIERIDKKRKTKQASRTNQNKESN